MNHGTSKKQDYPPEQMVVIARRMFKQAMETRSLSLLNSAERWLSLAEVDWTAIGKTKEQIALLRKSFALDVARRQLAVCRRHPNIFAWEVICECLHTHGVQPEELESTPEELERMRVDGHLDHARFYWDLAQEKWKLYALSIVRHHLALASLPHGVKESMMVEALKNNDVSLIGVDGETFTKAWYQAIAEEVGRLILEADQKRCESILRQAQELLNELPPNSLLTIQLQTEINRCEKHFRPLFPPTRPIPSPPKREGQQKLF